MTNSISDDFVVLIDIRNLKNLLLKLYTVLNHVVIPT